MSEQTISQAPVTDTPSRSPRVAIAGVTGYAGAELARILLRHPRLAVHPPTFLGRMGEDSESARLTDLHPQLTNVPHANQALVVPWTWDTLTSEGIDVLVLATPHEQSRAWVPEALARGMRVLDLSGAWRLKAEAHRSIYRFDDHDPALAEEVQRRAVYGSPELHGTAVHTAKLVANPGCYATSIILALAPLLQEQWVDVTHGIIADAKSGVSGAGKAPSPTTHFMYAADNLSAYALFGHRHIGELKEQLGLTAEQVQFTPHLLPIPRGILSTVYLQLGQPRSPEEIQAVFERFYTQAPMVRLRQTPMLPQIQHVVRSPFCDLGFQLAPDGRRLVLISCLDNLLKGAASQAVENLNLMFGWDQGEGLL